MGLSQRVASSRVSRENMKMVIFAAVLIAYVTADGSMPTVGEVDMIPETELVSGPLSALMKTHDRFSILGKLKKGARRAVSGLKSLDSDGAFSKSSLSTGAITMSLATRRKLPRAATQIQLKKTEPLVAPRMITRVRME